MITGRHAQQYIMQRFILFFIYELFNVFLSHIRAYILHYRNRRIFKRSYKLKTASIIIIQCHIILIYMYMFLITNYLSVRCNPGRPDIQDSHNASRIFSIAEANRNTTADGYLSLEEMGDIFHNFDINGKSTKYY
jgi:hypothetical protein